MYNSTENVATVGFARRAAEYKRADFLFTDLNSLRDHPEKCRRHSNSFSAARPTPGTKPVKPRYRRVFDMPHCSQRP